MDEDRIGLVLLRTSELRSKLINCSHRASNGEREGKGSEDKESEASPDGENQEEDDNDAEAESLLNIKDALESLEGQLCSLQALQQQQWYEKESALAEIKYSQKKLLKELKDYRGKDFEVIYEAIAFACETEDTNDLLLPPYPSRLYKSAQNGGSKNLQGKKLQESERNQAHYGPSLGPFKRFGICIGAAAKTALTVVGVITILSLAGFEPRIKKWDSPFKRDGNKGTMVKCPPGKVPVVENGEVRCVVKERVEIPFESAVATPNVSYGCG